MEQFIEVGPDHNKGTISKCIEWFSLTAKKMITKQKKTKNQKKKQQKPQKTNKTAPQIFLTRKTEHW